jgi:transposase-like protein
MKSLRMTIKAHLKTELKRRTAQASNGSATPAAVAPTPTPAPAETVNLPQETSAPENEPTHQEETNYVASEATVEAANDEGAVAPSIEEQDPTHGDMHVEVSHRISQRLKSDG